VSGFGVEGGKTNFDESWRRKSRLFPSSIYCWAGPSSLAGLRVFVFLAGLLIELQTAAAVCITVLAR
jgi:hypothetical protein